jgi:hypothetical protein
MRTKQLPVSTGKADLHFSGFEGQVDYRISGETEKLKLGPARVRGALTASPEVAEAAFRAGEGTLTLEGGDRFRIVMLGHTAGGAEVFVELRI